MKRLKRIRKRIRSRMEATWIWDKLFLDFYLDPRWTFRFKLLDFLSGGVLLDYVIAAHNQLKHMHDYDYDDPELAEASGGLQDWAIRFHSSKAEYWMNKAVDQWSRGTK